MDSETALMYLTGQRVVKKRMELNCCCEPYGYSWVLENGTEFRFLPKYGVLEESDDLVKRQDIDIWPIPSRSEAHEVHDVNFRILSVVKAEDGKSFLLRAAFPKMNVFIQVADTDGDNIKFKIGEDQSLMYYVNDKIKSNQVSKLWVDNLPNGDFKVHVKGPLLTLNGKEVSSQTTIPSSTGHGTESFVLKGEYTDVSTVDKILEMFKSSTANEGGGVLAQGTPEEEHTFHIQAIGFGHDGRCGLPSFTWTSIGYMLFCCPCLCVCNLCYRDDRHFGKFVEDCDPKVKARGSDRPFPVRLECKSSSMPIIQAEVIDRV